MKALVKSHSEKGIWLEDVPMPEVSSNDVLVKVQKTAICGTDIHIYNWDAWAKKTISVPMTTGHEFAGVIAELGESVVGLKVGDQLISSSSAELRIGNALCLKNIPTGLIVHNIEMYPGKGAQLVRSAGTGAQIMAHDDDGFTSIKLPSGSWIIATVTPGRMTTPELTILTSFNLQESKISSKLLRFIVMYLMPLEVEKSPVGLVLLGFLSRTRIFMYPLPNESLFTTPRPGNGISVSLVRPKTF